MSIPVPSTTDNETTRLRNIEQYLYALAGVPAPTPVTPGGSDGQVQINNAGAFGGIAASTVGKAVLALTNPSAITFLRMNANNTVTALSAVALAAALGATIPLAGSGVTIPDADTALVISQGSLFNMAAATAARAITLNDTGPPTTGECMILNISRTNAFAVTIKDSTTATLFVVPASVPMSVIVQFGGTHWQDARGVRIT